jgi:hypothetical protein
MSRVFAAYSVGGLIDRRSAPSAASTGRSWRISPCSRWRIPLVLLVGDPATRRHFAPTGRLCAWAASGPHAPRICSRCSHSACSKASPPLRIADRATEPERAVICPAVAMRSRPIQRKIASSRAITRKPRRSTRIRVDLAPRKSTPLAARAESPSSAFWCWASRRPQPDWRF